MKLRILGLVGILDDPTLFAPLWGPLQKAFTTHFPQATFEVAHQHFFPWEIEKIHAYGQRILKDYDDGTPTLLVGYSLGGIVACALAPHFTKTDIKGIISIASPLQYSWYWGYPIPYGNATKLMNAVGLWDPLATPSSAYVGADRRLFFPCDHIYGWMTSSQPAEKIAAEAATWLAQKQAA